MPASVIWALALCIMMLMLGMDTQFAFVETCVTALADEWPKLRDHKPLVLSCMCLAGLLFGLVFTLQSGLFWLNLIDYYVASWPLLLFSLCEVIVIIIYGVNRFSENMEVMTGKRFGWLIKIMWWSITPIVLAVLLVLSISSQTPLKDSKGVPYPLWAQTVAWAIVGGNVAIVPLYALYALLTKHRHLSLWQRFKVLLRPSAGWLTLDERAKAMDKRLSGSGSAGGDEPGPGADALERHGRGNGFDKNVKVAGAYTSSSSGYEESLGATNGVSIPSESNSSLSSTTNEGGAVSPRQRNFAYKNNTGFHLQQLANENTSVNGFVNVGFVSSTSNVLQSASPPVRKRVV